MLRSFLNFKIGINNFRVTKSKYNCDPKNDSLVIIALHTFITSLVCALPPSLCVLIFNLFLPFYLPALPRTYLLFTPTACAPLNDGTILPTSLNELCPLWILTVGSTVPANGSRWLTIRPVPVYLLVFPVSPCLFVACVARTARSSRALSLDSHSFAFCTRFLLARCQRICLFLLLTFCAFF